MDGLANHLCRTGKMAKRIDSSLETQYSGYHAVCNAKHK